MIHVDTNIILRYLLDPANEAEAEMARASQDLFKRVDAGSETITTSEAILTEVVYVLQSNRWYNLSESEISERFKPIIQLPGLHISNKRRYLRALDIFVTHAPHLDFEDAILVAIVEAENPPVLYSFDRDFDRVPQIERREP
ncbi:PIN domain-containing protein [soil metagenome]